MQYLIDGIAIILSFAALRNSSSANKKAEEANNYAKEANELAKQSIDYIKNKDKVELITSCSAMIQENWKKSPELSLKHIYARYNSFFSEEEYELMWKQACEASRNRECEPKRKAMDIIRGCRD